MGDLYALEDFQLEGAGFLAVRKQALLADEPGVGKSAQAVRGCDLVGARNILVLVPASVRINWLREFNKFSPFDRDGKALLDGKMSLCDEGVNVCSYDLLNNVKLYKSLLARHWDVLILDESHFLKGQKTHRTRAVYGKRCDGATGLVSVATRVWRLSGTPAPNNVSELWTHLRSAGFYVRGFYDFIDDFCAGFNSDYGFRITGTKDVPRLKRLLGTFMLRRKKEEVLPKLPKLTFEDVTIPPGEVDTVRYFSQTLLPGGASEFKKMIENMNAKVKAAVGTDDKLAALTRLSTSVGNLRRYIGLAKVPAYIAKLKKDLDDGTIEKIVVGFHHQDVGQLLRAELVDYNPVIVHGGTVPKKRQVRIDKFQGNHTCRVFLAQVQAAGTGITLTAAHRLDILEPSWVPADNAQLAMRIHRMGQTKDCHIRFFGCGGSVDADIVIALAKKTKEITKVIH